MLTLTFTTVITLVIFLIFLRIASRASWRPLIRHMVRRERLFSTHEAAIDQHRRESARLQQRMTDHLENKEKRFIRELDKRVQQAHRSRRVLLTEDHNRVELQLITLHEEMLRYLEKERLLFSDALPELIADMDEQFQRRGPRL